jgi:hypothetical protein
LDNAEEGHGRDAPLWAGAVVHHSARWRLLLLAEEERAAARGSLLVVVVFRANRRACDAIAEIRCFASSLRDYEWV